MTYRPIRFDNYIPLLKADQARAIARLFGGRSNAPRYETDQIILQGLADPIRVKAAYSSLPVWEQNALSILNMLGGKTDFRTLEIGLQISGRLPEMPLKALPRTEIIKRLLKRGLVLTDSASDPGYFSEYSSSEIWSDERLLQCAGPVETEAFSLARIGLPEDASYRRSAVIGLDLIGLFQAVEQMGGFSLTKADTIRVSDIRQLRKRMHWPEDRLLADDFSMPDPATALAYALAHSGMMERRQSHLHLKETLMGFADRPIAEQVSSLLFGIVNASLWYESDTQINAWHLQSGLISARLNLLLALKSLPLEGRPFYSPDDFDQAIFERIGLDYRLDGATPRSYYQNNDSKWRAKRRGEWLNTERWWLEAALKSWLYFLGIVELASDGNQIAAFRLSELGREVLHPKLTAASPIESPSQPDHPPLKGGPVWVVQPNFDVIVYLDQANSSQLAFLERHAERLQAHDYTAQYRLTRQSIYRGLEAGSSAEMLIQGLQKGANSELPQNILVEIEEWAALRERISLHRRAQLLEFKDAAALQKAVERGLTGRIVTERFLWINQPLTKPALLNGFTRIDYAQPLAPCLSVSESGLIQRKQGSHDLLLTAQLDGWTEKQAEDRWQITPSHVRRAVQSNLKVENLIHLLNERAEHKIPPLLEMALRNWGSDKPYGLELAQATLLRCPDPETFEALRASMKLMPFILGTIRPDIFIVASGRLSELTEYLGWLEFEISPELDLQRIARPRFHY